MRPTVKWKSVLVFVLLVYVLANSAVASVKARPRPERLIFPNVMDDAAADTYSPLIWCFLGGTVLVGCVRAVAMRKKKVRQYLSLSVDQ